MSPEASIKSSSRGARCIVACQSGSFKVLDCRLVPDLWILHLVLKFIQRIERSAVFHHRNSVCCEVCQFVCVLSLQSERNLSLIFFPSLIVCLCSSGLKIVCVEGPSRRTLSNNPGMDLRRDKGSLKRTR